MSLTDPQAALRQVVRDRLTGPPPEALALTFSWPIDSGSQAGLIYRIERDGLGQLSHEPPCEGYRRNGGCVHVERAIALAEQPWDTLGRDIDELQQGTTPVTEDERAAFALAVLRRLELARQAARALAEHQSFDDDEERTHSPFSAWPARSPGRGIRVRNVRRTSDSGH